MLTKHLFTPGIAAKSPYDGLNYTVLSYSTGGPGSFQYGVVGEHVLRKNQSDNDTDNFEYEQVAAITLDENAHGGGDVVVYARGECQTIYYTIGTTLTT